MTQIIINELLPSKLHSQGLYSGTAEDTKITVHHFKASHYFLVMPVIYFGVLGHRDSFFWMASQISLGCFKLCTSSDVLLFMDFSKVLHGLPRLPVADYLYPYQKKKKHKYG